MTIVDIMTYLTALLDPETFSKIAEFIFKTAIKKALKEFYKRAKQDADKTNQNPPTG